MSRSKSLDRENYHHGDLRRVLLQAARQLTAEKGLDGFTLREVARRAGVSHAAPYHHFADIKALAEALAAETYARLAQALSAAVHQAGPNPLSQLAAIGEAYIHFFCQNPAELRMLGHFDVCAKPMRDPDAAAGSEELSAVEHEADKCYGVLLDVLRQGQAAKLVVDTDVEHLALTCWATVHGAVTLRIDGLIGDFAIDDKTLASVVVNTLNHGLARCAN